MNLTQLYDLLALEYWDEQDWDFFGWSEDDESLTDDEDVGILLGKDLPDNDLSNYSWEGDEDEDNDFEHSSDSDEDSSKDLSDGDEELAELLDDNDCADDQCACPRCQGFWGDSDNDEGGDGDSEGDSGGSDAVIELPPMKHRYRA
jgi:hypothetical protein